MINFNDDELLNIGVKVFSSAYEFYNTFFEAFQRYNYGAKPLD